MTDEELIELYFARSEEAISATWAAYGPYCRAIALGILGSEEDFAAKELGEAISAFLRGQQEKNRGVFLRRYWYGDTVEEAARWAGWSVSKTKSALFRMRNRLRAYLEKEGFFP